jgi:hypothetical protein
MTPTLRKIAALWGLVIIVCVEPSWFLPNALTAHKVCPTPRDEEVESLLSWTKRDSQSRGSRLGGR